MNHHAGAQAATQEVATAAVGQRLHLADDIAIPTITSRDPFSTTTFSVVQWPIDPSSRVSSPFGPRVAPCA